MEDEPIAARRLSRLLQADPEVIIVAESGDAASALAMIESERPDILFLDIQIPGMNGLSLVRSLPPNGMPVVVFVTAYEEYAVQAFEAQAADYLLKPVSDDRLGKALSRAKALAGGTRIDIVRILQALEELRAEQQVLRGLLPRATAAYLERLLVKVEGRTVVMPVGEIDYIESSANYVKLHVGSQSFQYRQTLSSLADQLDPAIFARIHRTAVVNLERIREIQPWFSGDGMVVLRNGAKLRMSRSFRREVEVRLGSLRPE